MEAIFFCIGAAAIVSLACVVFYIINVSFDNRSVDRLAVYGLFFFIFLAFISFGTGGYVDNLGKIEQCREVGGVFVNDNCENWSK